jgi:hypothetical protein
MRTRLIKPSFFKHGDLFDAEERSKLPLRVAYAGLWCVADREGRFLWRPRELKPDILPHDAVDFAQVLDALERAGFIASYVVDGKKFGHIPTLQDHQTFHVREAQSKIPSPDLDEAQPRPDLGHASDSPRSPVSVSVSVAGAVSVPASASASAAVAGSVSKAPATTTSRSKAALSRRAPQSPVWSGQVLCQLCGTTESDGDFPRHKPECRAAASALNGTSR